MNDDKKLYKVECDPECGFMIRSHKKGEITPIVMKHVMDEHGMKSTEKEIEDRITPA